MISGDFCETKTAGFEGSIGEFLPPRVVLRTMSLPLAREPPLFGYFLLIGLLPLAYTRPILARFFSCDNSRKVLGFFFGERGGNRTHDPLIKSYKFAVPRNVLSRLAVPLSN
jgi:hypothetical protein